MQGLINYLIEMTCNYASLLATLPDMFPSCLPFNQNLEGVELSAFRILHLIEQRGYSAGFMNELNTQIKQKDEESYKELYTHIFTSIRAHYLDHSLTVFETNAAGYLDILVSIINDSEEMRQIFIGNR